MKKEYYTDAEMERYTVLFKSVREDIYVLFLLLTKYESNKYNKENKDIFQLKVKDIIDNNEFKNTNNNILSLDEKLYLKQYIQKNNLKKDNYILQTNRGNVLNKNTLYTTKTYIDMWNRNNKEKLEYLKMDKLIKTYYYNLLLQTGSLKKIGDKINLTTKQTMKYLGLEQEDLKEILIHNGKFK